MKTSLITIATKNYKKFIPDLIRSADKFFMMDHDVDYYLYIDSEIDHINSHRNIHTFYVPCYNWPKSTLFRYKFINQSTNEHNWFDESDYIYYIDCDTLFLNNVGDEILSDLTCVEHPWFLNDRGDPEDNELSTAYIDPSINFRYIQNCFWGGKKQKIIDMCVYLEKQIDIDYENGIIAKCHDESHANKYYIDHATKILSCNYNFQPELKEIQYFKPKIRHFCKHKYKIKQDKIRDLFVFSSVGSNFSKEYKSKVFSSWELNKYDSACVIFNDDGFDYDKYFKNNIRKKGWKYPNFFFYLENNLHLLDSYKYFAIIDDDLFFEQSNTLETMIQIMDDHNLAVASPSNSCRTKHSVWPIMNCPDRQNKLVITNFCEMGFLIIRNDLLRIVRNFYINLKCDIEDAGFDYFICNLANLYNQRIAILRNVLYTNPISKETHPTPHESNDRSVLFEAIKTKDIEYVDL